MGLRSTAILYRIFSFKVRGGWLANSLITRRDHHHPASPVRENQTCTRDFIWIPFCTTPQRCGGCRCRRPLVPAGSSRRVHFVQTENLIVNCVGRQSLAVLADVVALKFGSCENVNTPESCGFGIHTVLYRRYGKLSEVRGRPSIGKLIAGVSIQRATIFKSQVVRSY